MKLPIPALFGKKSPSNYYLALVLRDEKAAAIVLREVDSKLQIVGQSETFFSSPLEEVPMENLLESLDKVISQAEEALPPDIETEQTVFGVKDSWVEEKKIKKEYLAKLKKLCDELSLQPIGFMVVSEAISHLLSEEEGAPLSAILTEINKNSVTLSLFRAGKIVEAHSSQMDDSLPQTVDRLLHHFTIDVLPSRLILFNGGKVGDIAQEFIAHHWSKSIPFLHVPQISVLPDGFDSKAMVYGAAEQMGFSVMETLGDIKVVNLEGQTEEKTAKTKQTAPDAKKEKPEEEKQTLGEASEETETMPDGDNFGFVMGKDISSINPHGIHKTEESPKEETSMREAFQTRSAHSGQQTQMDTTQTSPETSDEKKTNILSSMVSALTAVNPLKRLPTLGGFNKWFLIIPVVLLLIIALGGLYLFSLKATVTLNMQTQGLQESIPITIRTDSSNDVTQKILAAKEVDTSVDGSMTTDATGQKEVGDKAKGTVTLYNSDASKKTLPAGTVLTSSNNIDFTLDKDTSVASATGDIFSGTKPGTAQADVTAKDIGTESNLPSNTKFTVSGVNNVAAKNDTAFSGGTKKEVTVVAKKDIDTLTTNLPKQLEDKARSALLGKADSGQTIVPEFTDVTMTKKSTDSNVGDQASKVTLKATVVFSTFEYSTADLQSLAKAELQGKYSQDQALSDKGVQAEITDIKPVKNNEADATLSIKAGLLPKLDQSTIVENIVGKSFTDAQSYLSTLPQVKSSDITLSPHIPFLPELLPRFSHNITVILNSND
ncbi:MAG TPA: baseplate J/gp47 family protein [Patescibacteria group bacterium]|nr:baseplate J/gp47 family protein [Patescibacteria group bacterium]